MVEYTVGVLKGKKGADAYGEAMLKASYLLNYLLKEINYDTANMETRTWASTSTPMA